jgi:hypothetical protein
MCDTTSVQRRSTRLCHRMPLRTPTVLSGPADMSWARQACRRAACKRRERGVAASPGGRAREFDSRMGLTINPLHLGWKAAQRRLVGARSIEDDTLGIAVRQGCPAGRRHQPSLVPSQSRLSAPPREDASMSGRESAARRARHAGGPHAGHRGPHVRQHGTAAAARLARRRGAVARGSLSSILSERLHLCQK